MGRWRTASKLRRGPACRAGRRQGSTSTGGGGGGGEQLLTSTQSGFSPRPSPSSLICTGRRRQGGAIALHTTGNLELPHLHQPAVSGWRRPPTWASVMRRSLRPPLGRLSASATMVAPPESYLHRRSTATAVRPCTAGGVPAAWHAACQVQPGSAPPWRRATQQPSRTYCSSAQLPPCLTTAAAAPPRAHPAGPP